MSKKVGVAVILILILLFAVLGARWVHYRLTHAITNAVFVETDSLVKVSFKRVGGRLEKLFKKEGDYVRSGEPLAKLEDRDYRLKLDELNGNIRSLEREVEALQIKRKALREEILQSMKLVRLKALSTESKLDALKVRAQQLRRDKDRLSKLYLKGVIPKRELERIETELSALLEEIKALEKGKKAILQRNRVLEAKLRQVEEIDKRIQALLEKKKALESKRLDLQNLLAETILKSPVDGYVVKRFVTEGEVVRQGQFIYALYDPRDVYILALLEETKLEGVKKGNRVFIKIDAYPDEEFIGEVEEINRATAGKFALIPRDITAGEFTKVAQRIPVKIKILKGNKKLLRIGMSGEVAIERKDS